MDTNSILLIIGAIGLAVVNIINAWRSGTKADKIEAKVDKIDAKTIGIESKVDGTASRQEARLDSALEKLEFMTKQFNEQKATAVALAAKTDV